MNLAKSTQRQRDMKYGRICKDVKSSLKYFKNTLERWQ